MSVRVPALIGSLAGVWAARTAVFVEPTVWQPTVAQSVALLGYGAAAALLVGIRHDVRPGAGLLVVGCTVELLARAPVDNNPVILLLWFAAILLVAADRAHEQVFLLRTCVTTVYVFAALSKLNPSWLAGEGVVGLELVRTHLGASVAAALPALVVALEGWLGVGLWFARTRAWTAALGVVFHLSIIALVSQAMTGALYLVVLNGALLAGYPTFWASTRPPGAGWEPLTVHVTAERRRP